MKGHIAKKGIKYYVVLETRGDDGKRKRKWHSGFKTKKEAQKFLNEQLHKMDTGTYFSPTKITVEEYLERWLSDYAKVNTAPRTYEGYEYIIRQHVIPQLGQLKIDKLKPLHIQSYYSNRLTEGRIDGKGGLSNRSVLHHHRVLHQAFDQAVKWQMLQINPVNAITPPKPQKKKMNVLSREQIQLLLQETKEKSYFSIIYMAIHTGMRRGEILGLRWSDIDYKNLTISINQTVQRLKSTGIELRNTTKTDGSRRSVAISESVIGMLKKVKVTQTKNKLHFGVLYQNHDLIFSNEDGSPIDPDGLSREFTRLVKRIDIPHIRFHDLRHTHATLLLQQGEHTKVVSERLGHSTIAITMDTYSHVMPNMQKEAAKKLDDFLMVKK